MRGLLCAVLSILGLAGAPAARAALDDCLDLPADERPACLDRWADSTRLDWRAWRELDRVLAVDPAAALRVVERRLAAGESLRADPGRAARAHDLKGRSLAALERHDAAAAAFLEALRLDEGTVKIAWLSETGVVARTDAIDPGAGRHEKAARALVAAGRQDEARPLLARALALGAGAQANELWSALDGGPSAPLEETPATLTAKRWFPALPEVAFQLLDGEVVKPPAGGAKAWILDFWASWCVPCADELPRLQQLYDAERARGLAAVAINMGEPRETVEMFADALALTLPVALYDATIERTLGVRTLPTVIVVDRLGRVRGRWNGYEKDLEVEIAKLARELLDDRTAIPRDELGRVILGAGLLTAEWSLAIPAAVDDLSILSPGEDEDGGRILLVGGRKLAVLGPDGSPLRYLEGGATAGLIRRGDLDGDGADEWVGFRRGASRVLVMGPEDDSPRTWDAPAPVLDVELLPATGESGAEIVLGTTGGLFLAGVEGAPFRAVGTFGEVRDLSVSGRSLTVLEAGGRVSRLEAELELERADETSFDGFHLMRGPGPEAREAIAPSTVRAWATGRFLEGDSAQIALATAGGQLLLIDLDGGQVRFRARWDGIGALAAGDLDGDGRDDLLVGSEGHVALLRGPARASRP